MSSRSQRAITRHIYVTIWMIAASCLWLSTGWSYRIVEQLEDAYELSIADLNLPDRANGSVSFQPCAGCAIVSLRLQAGSVFRVDGVELDFADFLSAVTRIQDSDGSENRAIVGVFFSASTGVLTRIEVFQL